jgi:enamine deaminase RidA (YjgF/YER057c/UK114 family)
VPGGIERFSSGGAWEARFGYSRAVRAGEFVLVAGTTAGASMEQVVQTRMFVTDMSRAEEIGRAHGARFGEHPPVSAMLGVVALIDPRMLVEIEAVAYVGS